jgi:hypothetical protein
MKDSCNNSVVQVDPKECFEEAKISSKSRGAPKCNVATQGGLQRADKRHIVIC